jgi:hypothetical protein
MSEEEAKKKSKFVTAGMQRQYLHVSHVQDAFDNLVSQKFCTWLA